MKSWLDFQIIKAFYGIGIYYMACRNTGQRDMFIVDDMGVLQRMDYGIARKSIQD